ncbi:hypothetical protein LCGC14_2396850, partial [marine sediment metagenome]
MNDSDSQDLQQAPTFEEECKGIRITIKDVAAGVKHFIGVAKNTTPQ